MSETQYYGTGRRKTSVARVFLSPGEGKKTVNGRDFDEFFPSEVLKMVVQQPLAALPGPGACGQPVDPGDPQATVNGLLDFQRWDASGNPRPPSL